MANTKLRVKVPSKRGRVPFSGVAYGLKFESGVSEIIHDKELYERLVLKGYEPYLKPKAK